MTNQQDFTPMSQNTARSPAWTEDPDQAFCFLQHQESSPYLWPPSHHHLHHHHHHHHHHHQQQQQQQQQQEAWTGCSTAPSGTITPSHQHPSPHPHPNHHHHHPHQYHYPHHHHHPPHPHPHHLHHPHHQPPPHHHQTPQTEEQPQPPPPPLPPLLPPTSETLLSLPPTSLGWPLSVQAPAVAASCPRRSASSSSSSSSCIPVAVKRCPGSLPPGTGLYRDNNPEGGRVQCPPVPVQFRHGCRDVWRWSLRDRSHEVRLRGPERVTALFHPNWSNGTAGVRGSKPINRGVHYWEILISGRIFGTSMMFGVATKKARLHTEAFHNLLGEDDHSWALSHKGLAWHGGRGLPFCPPFSENVPVCVGLVYDATQGTLTYYKNGESLGVAFRGLEVVEEDLFPAVCSTAAKTEMTLGVMRRTYLSLQDRCRVVVVKQLRRVGKGREVWKLPLPRVLCRYVAEEVP